MAKTQTVETERLNGLMDEMLRMGEKVKEPLKEIWRDGYNYIFHNQLANLERKKGWSPIQCNQIYPGVMQAISVIAQQPVKIVCKPWEWEDIKTAQMWQSLLQWQYEKVLNMQWMRVRAALDGAIYGHYVAKLFWEPKSKWDDEKKVWEGAIRGALIRPEWFGMDPELEETGVQNAAFCYTRRRVRTDKLKRRWPKFAEQIDEGAQGGTEDDISGYFQAQIQSLEDDKGSKPSGSWFGRVANFLRSLTSARLERQKGLEQDRGPIIPSYVTVDEVYFHDGETAQKRRTKARDRADMLRSGDYVQDGAIIRTRDGKSVTSTAWPQDEVSNWAEPKFPYGKRIVRVGRIILNPDEKDQVWKYPRWPFVVGVNNILPHTWAGQNAVEPARNLQDFQNGIMAHFENYVANFSDPTMKVEQGALADDPDMKNVSDYVASRAGKIIKLNPNRSGGVNPVPPTSMPGALFEIFNLSGKELKDQTGFQPVSLGRETERKETATAITAYMQQSKIRTGMTGALLDAWTAEVMEVVGSLIQKNVPVGQMMRVVGEPFHSTVMELTENYKTLHYDTTIEVGAALPLDKEKQKLDAAQLFEMVGLPMLEHLLEKFEVPNKDDILAEHEEYQQFVQWQESMQVQETQKPETAGESAA